MKPIRIAIIGYGKIAEDQHVPSIRGNAALRARRDLEPLGPGRRADVHRLARADPQRRGARGGRNHNAAGPRYEIARECVLAGLHCLLEKPPTAGLAEIDELARLAEAGGDPVHNVARAASFDSRRGRQGARGKAHQVDGDPVARGCAQMAPGPAVDLGAGRLRRVRSRDQRILDRDQDLPRQLFSSKSAELSVPQNAQTPIAADIDFTSPEADGALDASLDWRRTEGEEWTITIETTDGSTRPARGRRSEADLNGGEPEPTRDPANIPISTALRRSDRPAAKPGGRCAVSARRRLPACCAEPERRGRPQLMEQIGTRRIIPQTAGHA